MFLSTVYPQAGELKEEMPHSHNTGLQRSLHLPHPAIGPYHDRAMFFRDADGFPSDKTIFILDIIPTPT